MHDVRSHEDTPSSWDRPGPSQVPFSASPPGVPSAPPALPPSASEASPSPWPGEEGRGAW